MWIFWMTSLPIYMCLLYHHGNSSSRSCRIIIHMQHIFIRNR
nr:MAG TPA: hypothetical protein [Bacteriophage sp.]DAQ87856.1 MAG TPA: hypothetical protein [Caudoviricetes sp.]DAO83212.1 MAG TPA: hypothetical protein [Bacteriophage sp.]DAS86341.1 MAG TPA: hypothetical protein [Bacteriophage sp.]DAV54121.1 MAG TPA: hypothetical protein [Caudoviricetes sp.]